MFTRVITAPAAYPVTLTTAKEWCRIPSVDTTQNNSLNMLIQAMTQYAEHLTGRAFVERTLETAFPCWQYCFELPNPPLLQVMSIDYTDINETAQQVASSQYEVDTVSQPGKVRLLIANSWPSLGTLFNPVRIRYRAGYAGVGSPADLTDNSYLPPQLLLWIHARVATLYHQRSHLMPAGSMATTQIPRDFADALLDPLVIGTRLF